MLKRADRMQLIQPFHVMALLARARELESQGRSIIHMEIGEPDFVTPQPVIDAGIRALQDGYTHYTPATGLPALRERLAEFYRQRYDAKVEPRRVVITPGASAALQLVMAVLVNPGDRVLMADPGYPCNRNFVYLFNGQPSGIPVTAASAYQPTPQQVRKYWTDTVTALLVILIGGVGTLNGALIGAVVYRLLDFGLRRYLGESASFINGAIYILIVLFLPYGIVGTWASKSVQIKKGRQRLLKLFGVDRSGDS